jgi:hypothetical protein
LSSLIRPGISFSLGPPHANDVLVGDGRARRSNCAAFGSPAMALIPPPFKVVRNSMVVQRRMYVLVNLLFPAVPACSLVVSTPRHIGLESAFHLDHNVQMLCW